MGRPWCAQHHIHRTKRHLLAALVSIGCGWSVEAEAREPVAARPPNLDEVNVVAAVDRAQIGKDKDESGIGARVRKARRRDGCPALNTQDIQALVLYAPFIYSVKMNTQI